jgi:chromosome segregation ATPase
MSGEELAAAYCAGRKDLIFEYNPSYNYHADPIAILFIHSELRLVTDLQTNIKAQMSAAYARKVKISNLKEMARTVVFIQDLGIHSREELKERQTEIIERLRSVETRVKDTDSEIRRINQQIHFAGQYYANRSVHTDFMKAWNKGRFRSDHRDELDRYDEAVKFFNDNNAGSIPLIKDLKERKETLQSQKQQQLTSLKDLQQAQKNLQTAVTNVEAILGKEETKKRGLTQSNQPSRKTGPSL